MNSKESKVSTVYSYNTYTEVSLIRVQTKYAKELRISIYVILGSSTRFALKYTLPSLLFA
jgi:hypothetical protein